MNTMFRFEFTDETTETSKILAFNFKPVGANARRIVDENNEEALVEAFHTREVLEAQYGVHEAAFDPGFTTYEVPAAVQQDLMQRWAQQFILLGFEVGPIYETTDDTLSS